MNTENITLKNFSEYVSFLIYEFYKNNITPFLDALDENAVWVGANDGQLIHSAETIKRNFMAEVNSLQYSVGPIYTEIIPHGNSQCDTLSFFTRTSFHPNGKSATLNLVFHLSWVKDKTWKMSVISILNRPKKDGRDSVYPVHIHDIAEMFPQPKIDPSKRLLLKEKGKDNTILIPPERIQWAESDGHYCIIHFKEYPLTVATDIRSLAGMTKGYLLQCHSSYLVNPFYVSAVRRFSLTLKNGTELPVPEKKYTSFKKQLADFFEGKASDD